MRSYENLIQANYDQYHYHLDFYEDLGVIMSKHMDVSVNKANKVLGLLKSTSHSKNREIFSVLYRLLVRPILEYASPAWSPFLVKGKLAIKRTSRIALGQTHCEISYDKRCKLLGWSTLGVEENISLW